MYYYTVDEVSLHNTELDGWIIANNNVYDITNFVKGNDHPIPKEILLNKLGKDCTMDINFHSKHSIKKLEKFKIGKIINSYYYCTIF